MPERAATPARANPLYRAPDSYDFEENRKLMTRVVGSPHGYFRFVNREFSKEVCRRFTPYLDSTPMVNLHGDAHLEQYAVTNRSRGLADFDDSSTGPAVIDIVRFGVSIFLASRAKGWEEHASPAFRSFLKAYRAGLADPTYEADVPTFTKRMRQGFSTDRMAALAHAESLMEPLEIMTPEEFREKAREYAAKVYRENPSLPVGFFDVKNVGRLRIGIGSALDDKYLFRVEGPTKAAEDDLILEAKEVRSLKGVGCIARHDKDDVMRILRSLERIAYEPYEFTGHVTLYPKDGVLEKTTYWVHAWSDNYVELKIDRGLETPEDLMQIAADVGVQLGRGHPKGFASPTADAYRGACVADFDQAAKMLETTVSELAETTVAAWEQFKREAGKARAQAARDQAETGQ